MSDAGEGQVTSSGTVEELWNIAITSKDESDNNVPLKSSNEILSELFGAFNAEPPKSLLTSDNESEIEVKSKRHKKKHKKDKKHKKKSKSKGRTSADRETSSVGYSSDSDHEHEKHKEKKHKTKRKHTKSSNLEDGEDQKARKRSRHSRSPCKVPSRHLDSDSKLSLKEDSGVCETTTVALLNGQVDGSFNEVSSTSASSQLPPNPLPKKDVEDDKSVFDNIKPNDNSDEKTEKSKQTMGKIVIKDLKFSTVYEATVKEVEEQAKAKADKYEEGELSDTSSQKTSDFSEDPSHISCQEGVERAKHKHESCDKSKRDKGSSSKGKCSSHRKKSRHKGRSKSRSRSRSRSRDRDHRSRERDRHCKHLDRDKDKVKDKEKDYYKDKERGKHRSRDREDKEKERERKERDHKDSRRGRSHSRSPRSSKNRASPRSRRRNSRERRRSRSRSRDRKRTSSSDHIDKKKLLEIARRNAMNMLQAGILPGIMGKASVPSTSAPAPIGKSETSTAKTVDELTEYCKELSKRENMGDLSSLSGSEDSDSGKLFHHPFQVKDRPSFISLNIKNAVQLPLKSTQERTVEQSQLRIQFPVSSGQQHRKTESEWVPVTPQPKPEEKKSSGPKAIEAPKPTETKTTTTNEVIDIGTLVTQRLAAIRKKHDNEQNQYVDHMYGWNNVLPGQYTGDTGVRLLTPQQLAAGAHAWVRKDQLLTATPVRSGFGMTLLQKMGWKPGEGLGKNKEGCQEPLQLEVKMDRKGLVAAEEIRARRPPPTVMQPKATKTSNPVTLEGKHPVSLLTEYCSKRHYGAPHFELCSESGPDHKKDFLFKVRVNGLEYTPSTASPNKKQAKAEAATVCLKALGVLIS